ncbi:Nrap protein-domain-containing protein [Catenaria anguillulae PL171]|uniref:U3 small nucleolar RNA-associated protein 22 n=1 Tax=Catenaria anguillulae PL171 TaxID=765915 RepID=A0A1Y2H7P3_9FUNG|nr:Nrap protein-domain-containing protein [Catenaria anguillulae PL171]
MHKDNVGHANTMKPQDFVALASADFESDDTTSDSGSDVEMHDADDNNDSDSLDDGPDTDDNPMHSVLDNGSGNGHAKGAAQSIADNLTAHDLMQLDSALDLQTDSLLAEVSVTVSPAVRQTLVLIKSTLEGAKPTPSMSHAKAQAHLNKAQVAWPWTVDLGKDEINYQFAFAPPARVDVVGSFLVGGEKRGALIKRRGGGYNLDVAVEMPASLFQPKDHLNHRYFHKRSFYLAHVASELSRALASSSAQVSFAYDRNDIRKPILLLAIPLGKKSAGHAIINIRPTIASTTFKLDKLAPNRNNVRPTSGVELDPLPPTPAYNAQLLTDMHLLSHLHLMHKAATLVPHLPSAMKLLKVWCEQRALSSWAFPLTYLAAALAIKGQMGRDLKPAQIFRVVVFYVANVDVAAPLLLGDQKKGQDTEMWVASEVSWIDAQGTNLTWWAGQADAKRLKLEAAKAATLAAASHFEPLFLQSTLTAIASYDHLVRIPLPSTPPAFYNPRVRLDDPSSAHFLSLAIPRLLLRALTDRVDLIAYLPDTIGSKTWAISASAPESAIPTSELTFGLLLHPEESVRRMDIGPSPETDTAGATAFRRLWGSKAELRRFPDGTIAESVAWTGIAPTKIVAEMIDYVCTRHMSVTPTRHWGQHAALKRLRAVARTVSGGDQPRLAMDEAFQQLSRMIMDVDTDKVPLPVSAVLPVSPELTRTAIAPHRAPALFVARYHMSMLFLLAFAEMLESSSAAGEVEKCTVVSAPLSLDISFAGYLFKMVVKPKASPMMSAEIHHAMDMSNLSLIFPALGPTARLFKYFVAKHMLGYQVHDHIADLLVAHVFTRAADKHVRAPTDAMAGFVRVLELIGSHDWVKYALGVATRVGKGVRSKTEMIAGVCKAPLMCLHHPWDRPLLRPRTLVTPSMLPASAKLDPLFALAATGLSAFDLVVYLKPDVVNKYVTRGVCLPSNEFPGFNPVDAWIRQVVSAFGGLLRVFFNDLDGSVVGIVVDPMQMVPKRLTLASAAVEAVKNPMVLGWGEAKEGEASGSDDDEMEVDHDEAEEAEAASKLQMMPNLAAIAADIVRLGDGLVDRVVIQKRELVYLG